MSEPVASAGERRRRGGARAAIRAARTQKTINALPTLERKIPPYEVLDEEQLERIHQASMKILEEVGIDFRDPEALADWRAAGADVQGERVRIPRELLMELVAKAPSEYTMHARNPERTVKVGNNNSIFVPMYGAPYVRDLNDQRRYSTLEDLQNFHRLAYMSPALHNTGFVTCEPVDIPVPWRHLDVTYSCLSNSDKSFMGAVTAGSRAQDTVDMAKIAFGDAFVNDNTVMTSVISCNSPLVWDQTMLEAMRVYCRQNQAVLCAPFVMGGANTPASTVAAVAQLNGEALAGIAYGQLVRAGSPTVYGHFLSTVSMKSGAPMAGTPEISMMNFIIGQLARRYDLPWRSTTLASGSKVFDAQSGYESATTAMAVLLAGTNYMWHSAGWDEAGMAASFAKFVVDAEQCAMLYKLAQGPDFSDFDEALEAVREVGPGGHYLGTAHTLTKFETAFFMPELFDNSSFEQWSAEGRKDTNTRGLEKARQMLADYEKPAMDPAIDEALQDFVRRRKAELPKDQL